MSFVKKNLGVIILAAGRGDRMQSNIPKVMHKIAGHAMLEYSLMLSKKVSENKAMVIASNELSNLDDFKLLRKKYDFEYTIQEKQLGTAHALWCGIQNLKNKNISNIFVLYGDVPLVQEFTAKKMLDEMLNNASELVLLTFKEKNFNSYGKVLLNTSNSPIAIEEDLNAKLNIELCNAGIMLVSRSLLEKFLNQNVGENEVNQYLTNIVSFALNIGIQSSYIEINSKEAMGVNTKDQLLSANNEMQRMLVKNAIASGANILSPQNTFLSASCVISKGAIIYPFVYLGNDAIIESDAKVLSFSHIEESIVQSNATVGPFACIKKNSIIESNAVVGNFVEIKNSSLGNGSKAKHLSYIGDTSIEDDVNIGAGVVFCNYDGSKKHRSFVSSSSFVGANSVIISPVTLGKNSMVAAGSIITSDVPDSNLAIARSKQVNKKR